MTDLNQALKDGRLPSLSRQLDKRELLSPTIWRDDLYLSEGFSLGFDLQIDGVMVFSHALGDAPAYDRWFFVWWPAFEKIWPASEATLDHQNPAIKPPQEPKAKRGRRAEHDWTAIRADIVRRHWRDGKFIKPKKSEFGLAIELCDLAGRKHPEGKEPPLSEMRRLIADVLAVLKMAQEDLFQASLKADQK